MNKKIAGIIVQTGGSLKDKLTVLMAVLTVMGIVTFSLFILEEAFQTTMFGTWPAQDAKDWAQVLKGAQVMSGIVKTMDIINYTVGWIQPLAFVSYRTYAKSARYYTESLKRKIFAHAPELFVNKKITFTFHPRQIKIINHSVIEASYGKIRVILPASLKSRPITVSGVLRADSTGKLIVDMTNEMPGR